MRATGEPAPIVETGRPSNPAQPATRPPASCREPLRWLVAPWTVAVFYPIVLVTTVLWGFLAVVLSAVNRRVGHHCGTVWAWCLTRASFVRVVVDGREHMQRGRSYVIMTNHQGDYDILALYGDLRRQFRWVMKAELRKVPFLGWGCAAIGHVFVDRSNSRAAIASLEAAKPRLTGGVSVLFFPEGTRSTDGRLLPFKKGGFVMARQLGFPILPLSISGSARILPKRCLLPRPGTIRIRIHPAIDPAAYPSDPALIAAVRAAVASGLEPDEGGGERPEQPVSPASARS
ncbi:MAG: 1-acyl-sn-glycerol-3-phosphate acyltransferase [Acidobacteria bacterium]|nr:1-acyl-sn-glycerol-3-phosphate acyltransferase [Acidobacteriota bacterium]